MNRRGFMQGILAAGAAPWVCTKAGVLMAPRHVFQPTTEFSIGRLSDLEEMMLRREIDLVVNPPLYQAIVDLALYGSCVVNFAHEVKPMVLVPAHFPRARVRVWGNP